MPRLSWPRLCWIIVPLALLAACDDGPSTTSCLPDCAGDRGYDAVAYHLRASFDFAAGTMTAAEDITVIAPAPIIELDAAVTITAVHADATQLAFAADPTTGKVRVDLGPLAPSSDSVTFTVDYTAAPSDALRLGGPRDDDPVRGTVLFTDSEPDRGLQWLVAKHDPSDRAELAVDLDLPAELDAVSNGARTGDDPSPTGHVVHYAITQPIPTYLMAFAAGDLVHEDRTTGRVPLAIWHRRGLAIDANQNLDAIADAMATFEALIGPYPWDSYAVVLAPGFGGGMENATITFNAESSGLGNVGFVLNAHELAHHWFGDWVTMRTYDDVWFKEGMATLLEAEAQRARRDHTASVARLFGSDNTYSSGDAIVDPELHGLDKYTSGPYQRAAWSITQVRALIGEQAFWSSLRGFLAANPLGTATGEMFVRSFAPALDEAHIQQWLAALPSHSSPAITATALATAGGTQLALTVDDPDGTLLAPLELTVVDATGAATPAMLPATITVPAGGYLALDEHDVHPSWPSSFDIPDASYNSVSAVSLPGSTAAITAWEARSAADQERVMFENGLPSNDVTTVVGALDSTLARRSAVFSACRVLPTLPATEAQAMRSALAPLLASPALPNFSTAYGQCGTTLAQPLGDELASLADTVTPATTGRLDYLMSFDHGDRTFALISKVATGAPTVNLRDRAISRLAQSAAGIYSAIPPAQLATWQAFFRDRFAAITSAGRFAQVWRGEVALGDVAALPLAAPLLHTVAMAPSLQELVVCDAFALAGAAPGAWEAFQAATMPWETLSPGTAALLADPTQCNAQRRLEPARRTSKELREVHQ
jgi:hypothetical protein